MRAGGRAVVVGVLAMCSASGIAASDARAALTTPVDVAPHVSDGASAVRAAGRLEPPPRTFSVAATGDMLADNSVLRTAAEYAPPGQRFDFAPVFAPVAPIIQSADLAICHAEVPIGAPGAPHGVFGRSLYGGNLLLAPNELAGGLAATGFDRCTTASNHSNDLGIDGIGTTLDSFDAVGITHVGTARDPAGAVVATFVVNGVRVAHLAYTTQLNTSSTDAFRLNFAHSAEQVAADVAAARSLGAEAVIVSIHVGFELQPAPIPRDRAFITTLTALAPIDLVIEHGPHVIQPVEQVNGTWVYWSVGNFSTGMGWAQGGRYADMRTLDGLIATARFTETSPGEFGVEPIPVLICNERTTRIVHPVISALSDPDTDPALRDQLQECLDRSAPVVADLR